MEALRASERQRDRAVQSLGAAYRHGLLSTGTFELRVETALRVRTTRELRRLLADLGHAASVRLAVSDRLARRSVAAVANAPEPLDLVLPANTTHVTVGRHPNCDVVLGDPTVSRHHASVRREQGRWVLHDLGSSNGSWLNGRRAARIEVVAGDELRFGELVTRVVTGR
jgi:hypothetical protein